MSAIETAISDNQVSRIIHTAAILPPTSKEDPSRGCDVNIGGTNNIFDATSRLGVKRVVYPSSIAVYGDQSDYEETVLNEKSPRSPFSLYGVARQANELAARAYFANTGLDSRELRICTVFGHGRVTGRSAAASAMISAVAIGEPYVVLLSRHRRPLTFILRMSPNVSFGFPLPRASSAISTACRPTVFHSARLPKSCVPFCQTPRLLSHRTPPGLSRSIEWTAHA